MLNIQQPFILSAQNCEQRILETRLSTLLLNSLPQHWETQPHWCRWEDDFPGAQQGSGVSALFLGGRKAGKLGISLSEHILSLRRNMELKVLRELRWRGKPGKCCGSPCQYHWTDPSENARIGWVVTVSLAKALFLHCSCWQLCIVDTRKLFGAKTDLYASNFDNLWTVRCLSLPTLILATYMESLLRMYLNDFQYTLVLLYLIWRSTIRKFQESQHVWEN